MLPKINAGFGLPEGNDGWTDWTWFHARASAPQRFTVLCREPVNYAGHFKKGRMVPCLGEGCPLCAMGLGSQARYVVSVVEWESKRVGLFEVGRGHALCIADWAAGAGGLRGLSFEVQRVSHSKQARMDVRLVTDEAPLYFHHLEGPDLAKALASTFKRGDRIILEDVPSLPVRERSA